MTPHSSGSRSGSKAGTAPARSNSYPLWTSSVASPPSSTIRSGPRPSGQTSASFVHHQYSGSVSPFHAKTGTPRGAPGVPPLSGRPTATAAAAWSWVEKMLQDAQRTSAPRSASVSISTAVCTVMCRLPITRAPASGRSPAWRRRSASSPGISCSASLISLRPRAAAARSATLQGWRPARAASSNGWISSTSVELMKISSQRAARRGRRDDDRRRRLGDWPCGSSAGAADGGVSRTIGGGACSVSW